MLQIKDFNFSDPLSVQNLILITIAAIILIVTIISDKIIRRIISRYSTSLELDKHVENLLKLVARLVVFSVGTIALLQHLGIGTEWFLGLSALTGAAIGFASTQTVGNFLAGLYIMISRPFMVKDYVNIGGVEGEVKEITINYTKIYTPTYNIILIPNKKVLDSTILNHSTKENIIDYSVQIGFPHSEKISNKDLLEKCITPEIENFYNKHKEILPKKPEVGMNIMDRFERGFLVRIYFPEGDIDTFYDIQPELMQNIVQHWDEYKKSNSS
jgi:small-conductance mechanosensitive channel